MQLYLEMIKDNKCYDIDFFLYKYFQSSLDFLIKKIKSFF